MQPKISVVKKDLIKQMFEAFHCREKFASKFQKRPFVDASNMFKFQAVHLDACFFDFLHRTFNQNLTLLSNERYSGTDFRD